MVEFPLVPCSPFLATPGGCWPLGVATGTAAALATERTGSSCVGFGWWVVEVEVCWLAVTTTSWPAGPQLLAMRGDMAPDLIRMGMELVEVSLPLSVAMMLLWPLRSGMCMATGFSLSLALACWPVLVTTDMLGLKGGLARPSCFCGMT